MKLFRTLIRAKTSLLRVVPLMRDARVPGVLKWGAGALALLVVSPLDLFGDIPLLGLLDDTALLSILAVAFVALATRHTTRQATVLSTDLVVR
jgi:uncharacterized membrane protein YkvA (DUF1232 family)